VMMGLEAGNKLCRMQPMSCTTEMHGRHREHTNI
jgi:hypothetical protein